MKKIQTPLLLIAALSFGLAACDQPKHKTVSEYLHDIDSAKALLKKVGNNPASYQNDPDAINANKAIVSLSSSKVNDCWPKKPVTTAGTDHACLDAAGYKR